MNLCTGKLYCRKFWKNSPRFIHNLRTICGFLWITIPFLPPKSSSTPFVSTFSSTYFNFKLVYKVIHLSTMAETGRFHTTNPLLTWCPYGDTIILAFSLYSVFAFSSHYILCFSSWVLTQKGFLKNGFGQTKQSTGALKFLIVEKEWTSKIALFELYQLYLFLHMYSEFAILRKPFYLLSFRPFLFRNLRTSWLRSRLMSKSSFKKSLLSKIKNREEFWYDQHEPH